MTKKPLVYLCAKIKESARPANNTVAASLKAAGFAVYVPHEQAPNNPKDGRFDAAKIFELDFGAMQKSSLCVVVGDIGCDCSAEIGWFAGQSIPIFHVPNGDTSWTNSPMLIPFLTKYPMVPVLSKAGEMISGFYLNGNKLCQTK
jgi:nucleoside 2-deoxyribosyltransferase